jgi:hypothetical protein
MIGIERYPEALAGKKFVIFKADWHIINVWSAIVWLTTIRIDAPANIGIPLAAFDEEIHPRRPPPKIKANHDQPWFHNSAVSL